MANSSKILNGSNTGPPGPGLARFRPLSIVLDMKYTRFLLLALTLFLAACAQEMPVLDLNITPSTLAVDAGQPIQFDLTGKSEFLVFYAGTDGRKFEDYPNASATSINMRVANPTFSHTYNLHGTVKATFVATSYGNWSEALEEKVFEFEFTISDNNTNVSLVVLKTPGLFGQEYEGVIDAAAGTVTVTMPASANLSQLTTTFIPASTLATVTLDGAPFANRSVQNFSSGARTFRVTAAGGDTQDWVVQIAN